MYIPMKLNGTALLIAAIMVSNPLLADDDSDRKRNKVKDVNVVNTPDVNVANMPDVNVANTPDVNVANVPDVVVANTQAEPVPVIDEGRGPQPTIYREQFVLTVPTGGSNFSSTFSVGPSNPDHIRVIEHISVRVALKATTNVTSFRCTLRDSSFVEIVSVPLILERQLNNQIQTISSIGNQPIRLYINDGERLACSISLDALVAVDREVKISLIGYDVERARNSLAP